ncbi:hypothetical protein B0H13DRAFT_1882336 [Mycena leptocephala]|nr:hypothetical protein B0H13DRAFT_1882336 [Mycena leptocephala]
MAPDLPDATRRSQKPPQAIIDETQLKQFRVWVGRETRFSSHKLQQDDSEIVISKVQVIGMMGHGILSGVENPQTVWAVSTFLNWARYFANGLQISQEAVNQSPSGVTNLDKSWHADTVTRIAFIRTLPSQATQKQRSGHAVRIALPGSVASGEISSIFPFQNILTRASFSISPVDDNSLACTTYSSMTTPLAVDCAVSFRLVGQSQPPLDQAQHDQDVEIGEQVVNQYGDNFGQRNLQSRTPASFDPRPSQVTSRKDQGTTGLCGKVRVLALWFLRTFTKSTAFSGHCPAHVRKDNYKGPFPNLGRRVPCTTDKSSNWPSHVGHPDPVGNAWIASEDYMPWSIRDNPHCQKNQCGLSQYGKLPYITDRVSIDATVLIGKRSWELIKEHLSTIGPVTETKPLVKHHGKFNLDDSLSIGLCRTVGDSGKLFIGVELRALGVEETVVFIAAGSMGTSNFDSYGVKVGNLKFKHSVREEFPFFNKLSLPGDVFGG